ncbi:hypothetical protein [Roseomonas sp. BN140053]|uniref:hypothetical protein n=1 Tax=Roseomonas sp. BN140053 TaxID=3391898 RepID=UPI0039EC1DF2
MAQPPNGRERDVLRRLSGEEWEHLAQLYAGEKTISTLLERQWVEELPLLLSGTRRLRITPAGKVALTMPAPEKPKRAKLPMLKPIVPILRDR